METLKKLIENKFEDVACMYMFGSLSCSMENIDDLFTFYYRGLLHRWNEQYTTFYPINKEVEAIQAIQSIINRVKIKDHNIKIKYENLKKIQDTWHVNIKVEVTIKNEH